MDMFCWVFKEIAVVLLRDGKFNVIYMFYLIKL